MWLHMKIIKYMRLKSFLKTDRLKAFSKKIVMSSDASKSAVKGEYVRKDALFRRWITADGSSGFKAEPNRYHIYVSLACPWAHRALVMMKLKGLDDVISYTVVDWFLNFDVGWEFTDKKNKCTLDTLNGCKYLSEIYKKADPEFHGRPTVPCLWDKQNKTIVSNESSEIIRMLNTEFNEFCATKEQKNIDFYPPDLQSKIDALNEWIYPDINNGVYRCGFAKTQEAYDIAVTALFKALDKVEDILSEKRYLTGNRLTEADIRLFTTLIRFDMVYVGHFKCNKRRIMDYPNIWGYLRELYQIPGIASTVDAEHIQYHYQTSHISINPLGIVAIGPDLDFTTPHGRHCVG